jgi:hypothetical protein
LRFMFKPAFIYKPQTKSKTCNDTNPETVYRNVANVNG